MKKLVLTAIAASLMPMSAHAACATDAEANALNLRALKSSLMVAALSCGQQAEYNAFINKNQMLFAADGSEVKGYFSRTYGGNAEYQMNRFVTRMANEASNHSMGQESMAYCSAMKDAFRQANGLDRAGVKKLASGAQYASLHGIKSCNVGSSATVAMNSGARGTR